MTELLRHTLWFVPLPVFSCHFRFVPLGAFYYWRPLVHTLVLYRANVSRFANFIYDRAPRQASWKSSASWAASFATRPPEPRNCRMSYPIAEFSFFLFLLALWVLPFEPRRFSIRGCQTFTACAVQHLLFSNLRIFAAHLSVHGRVSVFAAFSAPYSGGFRVFWRPRLPPICRLALVNLGANWHSSDRCFFTCLLHLKLAGFHVSILADRVFVTSLRQFRYSLAGSRISSQTIVISSCQVVSVSPALFVGSSFLLRRSSGSSNCQIELVNLFTSHFKILEEFTSGSVPTLIRFRSGVDPFYSQLFHFIVALDVHSLISINRSTPFQHLNFPVSTRPSGAGPEQM